MTSVNREALFGQALPRLEDQRFVQGQGTYVDDVDLPRTCHAAFVRSTVPNGRLVTVDTEDAASRPGVLSVLTGKDWHDYGGGDGPGLWLITDKHGQPMNERRRPMFVTENVRYVGDTIAMVVAETKQQAEDAVAMVRVEIEESSANVLPGEALASETPVCHPEFGTNLVYEWEAGDEAATDAAFESAAHVVSLDFVNNRVSPAPMEPRAVLGHYEGARDKYTLWTSTQNPHWVRYWLAHDSLRVEEHRIDVIAPDVGGAFGQKIYHYTEEAAVLWASKRLGRPVRWNCSRLDAFLTDAHSRDHVTRAEISIDDSGRISGLREDLTANMGAYLSPFAVSIPTYFHAFFLSGLYAIPAIHCRVSAVYTNTVPVDAYRGAGRPEAVYTLERMVELAARQIGMDPAEFRKRNLIPADSFPHPTATGVTYDSGDYPALFEKVMNAADYQTLRKRQVELRAEGRYMGIGIAGFVECAGAGPSKQSKAGGSRVGYWDVSTVRVLPSGRVVALCGSHSQGQGHATTFAQVLADKFGCRIEDVEIVEGDTSRIPHGQGTWASRSLSVVGVAMATAADRVVAKGQILAGHLLGCDPEQLEFDDNTYHAPGTNLRMGFDEVAEAAYRGHDYPDGFELGLEETVFYDPDDFNYPSGVHLVTVMVDPDTGMIEIGKLIAGEDCGRVVNPLVVAGQLHGGAAQGFGQAMLEGIHYDPESGQLVTASFMDYAMPRADNLPDVEIVRQETPCPGNPLGVKGSAESGTIAPPAALANAVMDALSPFGVRHINMPMTPEKVWKAIQTAQKEAANGR